MNAEHTLTQLKVWCVGQSGNEQVWTNKGTTYRWNRGKETSEGIVNGVVRKLAGIDANGDQLWVVAGSIKINGQGTIIRMTGVPKKLQKSFEPANIIIPKINNDEVMSKV
jgi:hypothetical protein